MNTTTTTTKRTILTTLKFLIHIFTFDNNFMFWPVRLYMACGSVWPQQNLNLSIGVVSTWSKMLCSYKCVRDCRFSSECLKCSSNKELQSSWHPAQSRTAFGQWSPWIIGRLGVCNSDSSLQFQHHRHKVRWRQTHGRYNAQSEARPWRQRVFTYSRWWHRRPTLHHFRGSLLGLVRSTSKWTYSPLSILHSFRYHPHFEWRCAASHSTDVD